MEVVTGATGSVLTKVGALLQAEYIRQKGVEKDVESLQKELFFMRAALCKVAEVPPEQLDEQVKAWASNVKELSYDMEDAVDTFAVRVTATKDRGRSKIVGMRKWNRFTARRQLADVIAEMKDLTMQVADLRERYRLDDIHVTNTMEQVQDVKELVSRNSQLWTWWRQHISSRIQEVWAGWRSGGIGSIVAENSSRVIYTSCIVNVRKWDSLGMNDEMKKLHQWVMNHNVERSMEGRMEGNILYVVGDEGVGKTSIAMSVYHKFGHLFDRRVIVKAAPLGSDAGPKDIKELLGLHLDTKQDETNLGAAIGDALTPPIEEYSLRSDVSGFLGCVSRPRNLFLIDGVESDETWKLIKCQLPAGSKIIVTTRNPVIASLCNEEKGDVSHNPVLGKKEAKLVFWQALMESRGDEGQDKRNHAHDNIPPRVWEMCAKQIVALIAMAGYAAYNPDKSPGAWTEVCNKLLPESVKDLSRDDVPRVLSHCYQDMSAEIKTCCLYLSMFPKGQSVSRKHLRMRWIAEGFVGEKPGQSVEEVADDYFDQLVRRKILQPVDISRNGKVKNFQVYAQVHDFIVSKASEENLVTVVVDDSPPASGKVRRLSCTLLTSGSGGEFQENKDLNMNMSHVRSLALFSLRKIRGEVPSTLLESPIVQVLDLEGCQGINVTKQHMEVICRMFLLKYLSLRRTCIQEIGSDIGSLKDLETLDVRETQVETLPDTIWTLQKLVNILGGDRKEGKALKLKLPAAKTSKGKHHGHTVGKMKALRVLSGIEITQELEGTLQNLTNLRKLVIYMVASFTETMLGSIGHGCLRTLVIIGDGDNLSGMFAKYKDGIPAPSFKLLASLELSGKLEQLPKWIQQLTALTKLTLPITVFRSDPLLLKELSNLKNLFCLAFSTTTPPSPGCICELQLPCRREIIVPSNGFDNLKLLQFISPLMPLPPLSFLDNAMSKLERINLHFTDFEGLHGIHNLRKLQEVHIKVKTNAGDFTTSMLRNLVEATRQDVKGPRIICDWYE